MMLKQTKLITISTVTSYQNFDENKHCFSIGIAFDHLMCFGCKYSKSWIIACVGTLLQCHSYSNPSRNFIVVFRICSPHQVFCNVVSVEYSFPPDCINYIPQVPRCLPTSSWCIALTVVMLQHAKRSNAILDEILLFGQGSYSIQSDHGVELVSSRAVAGLFGHRVDGFGLCCSIGYILNDSLPTSIRIHLYWCKWNVTNLFVSKF
jgi:hypothetical protein